MSIVSFTINNTKYDRPVFADSVFEDDEYYTSSSDDDVQVTNDWEVKQKKSKRENKETKRSETSNAFVIKCMKRMNDTPSTFEDGHKEYVFEQAKKTMSNDVMKKKHFEKTIACKHGEGCTRRETCSFYHSEEERKLPMCMFLQYCSNMNCELVHPTEEKEYIAKHPFVKITKVVVPVVPVVPVVEKVKVKVNEYKPTPKVLKIAPECMKTNVWTKKDVTIKPTFEAKQPVVYEETKEEKIAKQEQIAKEAYLAKVNTNPFYHTLPCKYLSKCTNQECTRFHALKEKRYPMCRYAPNCTRKGCNLIHDEAGKKLWDIKNGMF